LTARCGVRTAPWRDARRIQPFRTTTVVHPRWCRSGQLVAMLRPVRLWPTFDASVWRRARYDGLRGAGPGNSSPSPPSGTVRRADGRVRPSRLGVGDADIGLDVVGAAAKSQPTSWCRTVQVSADREVRCQIGERRRQRPDLSSSSVSCGAGDLVIPMSVLLVASRHGGGTRPRASAVSSWAQRPHSPDNRHPPPLDDIGHRGWPGRRSQAAPVLPGRRRSPRPRSVDGMPAVAYPPQPGRAARHGSISSPG
jgi:hypothetical protein